MPEQKDGRDPSKDDRGSAFNADYVAEDDPQKTGKLARAGEDTGAVDQEE